MADDKTTLAYWMNKTGGRKNAAYTLQKEYNNSLQGRGPKPRTLRVDRLASTTPSAPTVSAAPKVSTTSGPNVGYKNPRDMAGKTNFKGTTGDKFKVGAAIVGGFAAVPAAVIAAPIIAGGVAGASAIGAYGGLGTGLAGAGGLAAKALSKVGSVGSKVGTRVSSVLPATKASKLAADTAAKKTAARLANAAARKKAAAAAAKKKAAAADKAQKGETSAMTNYAGALGQQDARMGGSGARR
jgi:hypothetical protein